MFTKIVNSKAFEKSPVVGYLTVVLITLAGLIDHLVAEPNAWGRWPTSVGVCLGYALMVALGAVPLWVLPPAARVPGSPSEGALVPPSEMVTHTRIFAELLACRGAWGRANAGGVLYGIVATPAFKRLADKILSHQYVLRKR